jgi:hypothetical protein
MRSSAVPEPTSSAILIPSADRERTLRSPTVIGSDPAQADVVIADPSIAARHAVLTADGTRWRIADLGSAHGTFVDGERVAERVLTGRHEVMLGRHRVAIVVERAVRLVEHPGLSALVRGDAQVALEPLELALVRELAAVGGFVRTSELAHLVPGAADLATPMIRQLARRLERKLAGLGEPPVIESCERRGYRLRAPLAREVG